MTEAQVLIARTTFIAMVDGRRVLVKKGKTRVLADHDLATSHPESFKPADVQFGVVTRDEDKHEPPAETAPDSKAVRAWAAENGIDVPKRGKISDAVVEAYTKAHEGS